MSSDLSDRAINTLRFLSADAVQQANSGHPGLPMGAAAMAYTIWTRHLNHNPRNPHWADRDRFILSGGHGSMLLYSLLHLTGYDLSLDELKNFRQWGSRTPGHPEVGLTPGVETTTGPLGQGFSNGVGMALAETHLAAEFNVPGNEVVNHYTYAIVTDGDLMEGVASEAASLAGHWQLRKLIYLYDDNKISIDGSTDLSFTEDRAARFVAYGWQVINVPDGNNVEMIDSAIRQAKTDPRPSLIVCRTHIGYGLPTRQDTSKAHGEPPGDDELNAAKVKMGWPVEPRFQIPDDVMDHFRSALTRGSFLEHEWRLRMEAYRRTYPQKGAELDRRLKGELPSNWDEGAPEFLSDAKGMATRAASGKSLNAFAKNIPELIGGSADLTPSNNTFIDGSTNYQKDNPGGRYIRFGVREHAMASITNGMALHGGVMPFCATFLVFSDYMRGALRISALSHIPSIWIFTHDSIGVGEDGPTHQPVEHITALRAIPNMTVIRPCDANETVEAWRYAVINRRGPTSLILTRQAVPTLDRSVYASASGVSKGAYVLADLGGRTPDIVLMASGSEVSLAVVAGVQLASDGVNVRIVSMPSWELFKAQSVEYRNSVLPPEIKKRISIEAGITQGWEMWVGDNGIMMGIDRYGASGKASVLFEKFGLTANALVLKAKDLLG